MAEPSALVRVLVALAGLFGAAGVAVFALAAHAGGDESMRTAALFLLLHGCALAATAALRARVAGLVLAAGTLLFCGDLLVRAWLGQRLFPMAAPTGGSLLIVGWLTLAFSALGRRE